MFEKYTDESKRSLFFARGAVTDHGGSQLEPEHLVLGVLMADPDVIRRFASTAAIEHLRSRLVAKVFDSIRWPVSAEIPFSPPSIQALERAQIEADDLSDPEIRPEHLLLGVLVKTSGEATDALTDAGVRISALREFLSSRPEA